MLWGCANKKLIGKIERLQKKCVRNVALVNFKSHTEPLFKSLNLLKFTDKILFWRANFVNKYRNKTLPISFLGVFNDITDSQELQTRNNWYNYQNIPAVRKKLEQFAYKQLISTWNSLEIELKSTSEEEDFNLLLKNKFISNYIYETDCLRDCYVCNL